jgi:hypothetical protein
VAISLYTADLGSALAPPVDLLSAIALLARYG